MSDERVTLAWWNTGLSPSAKPRPKPSDFSIAKHVIDHLLDDLKVDFCALGEIGLADVDSIREHCNARNYSFHNGIQSIGRSSFSTCFLVNNQKLEFELDRALVVSVETSNYKLAQKGILSLRNSKNLFYLFISHWPSRLRCAAGDPLRATLGGRLRQNVDLILNDDPTANVILMGDFNDEPFDASLSDHLRATRDLDLIKKKMSLLYNPFWRHFCHPEVLSNRPLRPVKLESWGTYHHKGGTLFQWRTFDQMMFSSSLLGHDSWSLNEASTGIVNLEAYTSVVVQHVSNYDHLPIIATLERKIHGGL